MPLNGFVMYWWLIAGELVVGVAVFGAMCCFLPYVVVGVWFTIRRNYRERRLRMVQRMEGDPDHIALDEINPL